MWTSRRTPVAVALLLSLCLSIPFSDAQEKAPLPVAPGSSVALHWRSPEDTTGVLQAAPGDLLEFVATVTGVDTIVGFQLEVRVHRDEASTTWRFAKQDECPAALLETVAEGSEKTPAPWRAKLLLSDARELQAGESRLMSIAAFHMEPLDAGAHYTLCRFRLTPPPSQEGACPGWDSDARFELVRATFLDARRNELQVDQLGEMLVLHLAGQN